MIQFERAVLQQQPQWCPIPRGLRSAGLDRGDSVLRSCFPSESPIECHRKSPSRAGEKKANRLIILPIIEALHRRQLSESDFACGYCSPSTLLILLHYIPQSCKFWVLLNSLDDQHIGVGNQYPRVRTERRFFIFLASCRDSV